MVDTGAPGTEIWGYNTEGKVLCSPTVADETVYVGSTDGVYALDAHTGYVEWMHRTTLAVVSSPEVVGDTLDTLYFGSKDHCVYALDAHTGAEKWKYSTGEPVETSPAILRNTMYVGDNMYRSDTTLYFGNRDNNVYALDANIGNQKWRYSTGSWVDSSPTVVDDIVYVGSDDGNLYALDADTGTEIWTYNTGGYVRSSPTVVDGTVYVGSNDNNVYALDADTGTEKWRYSTGDLVFSSPTVVDGTVYVGSNDNNVYALDSHTGSKKWARSTGGLVTSSPTITDGILYVGSNDGNLYALDAHTGTEKWRYSTGGPIDSSPVVVGGVLYVGSNDGNVYALNTESSGTEMYRNQKQKGKEGIDTERYFERGDSTEKSSDKEQRFTEEKAEPPREINIVFRVSSGGVTSQKRENLVSGTRRTFGREDFREELNVEELRYISEEHFVLWYSNFDRKVRIVDTDSTNGMEVDGRILKPNSPYPIEEGDEISLANGRITIVLDEVRD